MTTTIQSAVDEYVKLHKEAKEIERRLNELKEFINPFLDLQEVIPTSYGGAVARQTSSRVVSNSLFTAYEKDEIEEHFGEVLTPSIRKKIITPRISTTALEATIDLGLLPKEILSLRKVNSFNSLVVKK